MRANARLAQMVEARVLSPRQCGFDPHGAHYYALGMFYVHLTCTCGHSAMREGYDQPPSIGAVRCSQCGARRDVSQGMESPVRVSIGWMTPETKKAAAPKDDG